jgi:hypothetical protein
MQAVKRFHWEDPEYAEAFDTLLKCTETRVYEHKILQGIFSRYPAEARAIDWGAGGGDLTRLMLEHFQQVYAAEPSPVMRAILSARCPRARIFDGTITSVVPPEAVDVGVISHVFYHVPDYKWGAYTIHAANQLTKDGVLVVSLKPADSGCNRMLEHFGAPRYDLYAGLSGVIRIHREFEFSFTQVPGSIRTTSFDDTLKIARFMLCDRDADAFSRLPTEDAFQEYVRTRFWDEKSGTGGWDSGVMFCFVRRSTVYSSGP